MKQVAIIGAGPRGLSALENFYYELAKNDHPATVHVTLFETSPSPGNGSVWNTEQLHTNWLNISERNLNNLPGRSEIGLEKATIPSFPSYTQWLPESEQNRDSTTPDVFPPRAKMGKYLNERFSSIASVLVDNERLTIIHAPVESVDYRQQQFIVQDDEGQKYSFDEVLLTIGHQPTEQSDQIKEWKKHVQEHTDLLLFEKPYPAEDISRNSTINQDSMVGIRGFGLAMIDVARALTIEKGGKFRVVDDKTFQSVFEPSPDVPRKIVAFSLDGNPMAPKPSNAAIEAPFTPTSTELQEFGSTIERVASGQEEVSSDSFLKEAIAKIVSRVYPELENNNDQQQTSSDEIREATVEWLNDESYSHPLILPIDNPPQKTMKAFLLMGLGQGAVSLDYCIGQVWRLCQPTLYKKFAHANLPSEIISSVISLDERVKRYSYGPPLESAQQILALLEADVLTLDYVADPEITLADQGWELSSGGKKITVNVMINSVLDSPKVLEVTSPIIRNLLANSLIEPIHSELGIHTQRNACIELPQEREEIPLAILGRLTKGSVLGVDAILECFSIHEVAWAKEAVQRLNSKEVIVDS